MPSNDLFVTGVERLEEFFSKKLKGARQQYWTELSWMPDDAWQEVCKVWMRMHKPFPSHFPSIDDLKQGHIDWAMANPQLIPVVQYTFYRFCVDGEINVAIPVKKRFWYDHISGVVNCAHCGNYMHRNPTFPRMTREQIERKGWIITRPAELRDYEGEEDISVPAIKPDDMRSPGMAHIEQSLPIGDRDMGQDEIPF